MVSPHLLGFASVGAVAQSGSAPRSHRGGQGFESPQLHYGSLTRTLTRKGSTQQVREGTIPDALYEKGVFLRVGGRFPSSPILTNIAFWDQMRQQSILSSLEV